MRIQFSIDYRTNWGEQLVVCMAFNTASGKTQVHKIPLNTTDGVLWQGDFVDTHTDHCVSFTYYYALFRQDQMVRKECSFLPRRFTAVKNKTYICADAWRDIPVDAYRYTALFLNPKQKTSATLSYYQKTLLFQVQAPQLQQDMKLGIVGNIPLLGNWNPEKALLLVPGGNYEWAITLSAEGLSFPFEYKFVVLDSHGSLICWEDGPNRVSNYKGVEKDQIFIAADARLRIPSLKWKAAGVVIPLFSVKTDSSWGVGDFGDLKKLTDWAASTGMHMIQLLPLNDTTATHTWADSYPYNAVSVHALHPQYLDIKQLPKLKDASLMTALTEEGQCCNKLPQLDYEKVNSLKIRFLKASYLQDGASCLKSASFRAFYKHHDSWLLPYALFSYLREKYHTADFHSWPTCRRFEREKAMQLLQDPHVKDAVQFYFYMQYHLHCQLQNAHEYARSRHVYLKGDIPIGVSPNSVDAWAEPQYFCKDGQAGAPPDAFSENGQNWGFPTYDWEHILADGCAWWHRRLTHMATYFDAFRIDHVLGFFRIWEIPKHAVHGLLGQFVPALPLTVSEIESYGLKFREEFFTKPYISEFVLDHWFQDNEKELVKRVFLNARGYDWYEMKPEFDTERKVADFFARQKHTAQRDALRDALFSLISNVLFVPDRRRPHTWHPRIIAQKDLLYQALTPKEKDAFNALYEDYYYKRHNDFWYHSAMDKVPLLLEASNMLPCAEDLGMVPDCVAWVLDQLRILSLEIQSMPKQYGLQFSRLEDNPYRSVATIFTHDMPTLRLWWKEDKKRRNDFYHTVLQKDGEAPEDIPGWLCEEVVARHLFSPSMLCLISWQDWMSVSDQYRADDMESERINIPANPRHYWRYRMHMTVEQLMQAETLNKKIRTLISHSGRCMS